MTTQPQTEPYAERLEKLLLGGPPIWVVPKQLVIHGRFTTGYFGKPKFLSGLVGLTYILCLNSMELQDACAVAACTHLAIGCRLSKEYVKTGIVNNYDKHILCCYKLQSLFSEMMEAENNG